MMYDTVRSVPRGRQSKFVPLAPNKARESVGIQQPVQQPMKYQPAAAVVGHRQQKIAPTLRQVQQIAPAERFHNKPKFAPLAPNLTRAQPVKPDVSQFRIQEAVQSRPAPFTRMSSGPVFMPRAPNMMKGGQKGARPRQPGQQASISRERSRSPKPKAPSLESDLWPDEVEEEMSLVEADDSYADVAE